MRIALVYFISVRLLNRIRRACQVITTRHYQDRLRTLQCVREAGMTICCGGIIGMGESDEDRIGLLHQRTTLKPHPESVPSHYDTPLPGQAAHAAVRSRGGDDHLLWRNHRDGRV